MLDDNLIIEKYFARDETAITETSQKYGKLCYTISNNILASAEDAEECVNDTYLKLWHTIPPERPLCLKTFISVVIRNISLNRYNYLRQKKRSAEMEISLTELESILPDKSINPEFENGFSDIIDEFLNMLSADSRVIFVRKYWYFDSIVGIAHDFGFSESKVKVSLKRSRDKLEKLLYEKGVKL